MRAFIALTILPLASASPPETPVREQFTTLRTAAGTGAAEENGNGGADPMNLWQPEFEGADPKTVELSNPHACGTDAFGRIYIVDKESHSILRISADGKTLTTAAGTHSIGDGPDAATPATEVALDRPNGLHVYPDGSFLILDTANRKIRRVSPDGVCETLLTYPPGFGAGRGITASHYDDTIYFCGESTTRQVDGQTLTLQRVMFYRPEFDEGPFELGALPPGSRGLGNIAAWQGFLAVTSVGDHRVHLLPTGALPPVVIAGTGQTTGGSGSGANPTAVALDRVRGITFRSDGSYFLATQKGGDVWWVDTGEELYDPTDDTIHLLVPGARSGNVNFGDGLSLTTLPDTDRISEPRDVHLASTGELLITTNDNGFIRAAVPACPPTPPVAEALVSDDEILVRWPSFWQPLAHYRIESSPDLLSWQPDGVLPQGSIGFRRALAPGSARYWRVIVPQPPAH